MPQRIVIVEDDAISREVLEKILTMYGYAVVAACADVAAGITAVVTHKPDLVISDVSMRFADGFDLVRQLRGNPDAKDIPVIFYTAFAMRAADLAEVDELKVAAVVTKPALGSELLAAVTSVLGSNPGSGARP